MSSPETTATPVVETRSQKLAADVAALFRSRNPVIWIATREEARVEGFIAQAAASAGYKPMIWDVDQGTIDPSVKSNAKAVPVNADAGDALKAIKTRSEAPDVTDRDGNIIRDRNVWIMRDLPVWLSGPIGATNLRALRNLARSLPAIGRNHAQAIVILTTSTEVPPELAGHVTVVDWELPDRVEIAAILDAAVNTLPEYDTKEVDGKRVPDETKPLRAAALTAESRDAAIGAAIGLTGEEAAACFARSLVTTRKINPQIVSNEKKRVIARERVLEWFDPLPGGLDAIGGLENLKEWLVSRKAAYSPKARAYGLPAPKGALLVGLQGCGKSLTAKATATAWNVPLLRLDMGALKDKFVGGSEANLRKALNVIGAVGPCVVWIDEVEKAMPAGGNAASDGGVSADALGTVLTWLAERTSEAFVIMTSNDAEALPPELTRKGRLDEIWFVDLPHFDERKAVLAATLVKHGRGAVAIDLDAVAHKSTGFIGSEIAELVPSALYAAFAEDAREITTADLIKAASQVNPLSVLYKEKVDKLRRWGATRARSASREATLVSDTTGGELDID